MTIFSAVVAAVLIALLMFHQFRRMPARRAAATADAGADLDIKSSRQSHEDRAFSTHQAPTNAYKTGGIPLQKTGPGEPPSYRTSVTPARPIPHARLSMFSAGRFRRTVSRHGTQRGREPLREDAPDELRADARQLQDDEQFCGTLELLPFAILMTSQHGQIVLANAVSEKLFGYARGELIGTSADALAPALRDSFHSMQPGDIHVPPPPGATRRARDLVARRRDGTEFPAEITMNAISSGGDPCTLMVVIDRTERYELQRNRQQLAHLTRVSTLGELAGSLAHELNQPLTAILSNAQAAQRFMATEPINLEEVREILRDLVKDNHRASEVIRKIRALVKKGELEAAPLSIANVIGDVALLVHSDAIVRGIRVMVNIAPGLPPVHGDRVQLQQVILNLLLNAFDALESCCAHNRTVAVGAALDSAGAIRVVVRDSGPGLAGNTFDKLFMPFFTSKREGLGLGLSISRSIVEMHGGRIWAENNEDRGASFYFTLPASASAGVGACAGFAAERSRSWQQQQ